MTGDLIIRQARPDDAARVAALLDGGAVEGAPEPSPIAQTTESGQHRGDLSPYEDALREMAADERTEMLVAELDGVVVGMCQVIIFRHLQGRGGRCAELESVHVDTSLRSQGIGRALLAAAVDRARAAGCYRVQLTSNKRRSDAHRFYVANGFTASHEGFKLDLGD